MAKMHAEFFGAKLLLSYLPLSEPGGSFIPEYKTAARISVNVI